MPDDKVALIAVFVGLYLFDCILFLSPCQALARLNLPWVGPRAPHAEKAAKRSGPKWRVAGLDFGLTFYPVRGHFPAFLNPFTPFTAVFKSAPLLPPQSTHAGVAALPLHRISYATLVLRTMTGYLTVHAFLMFVVLPYLLITGRTGQLLIGVLFAFLLAGAIIAQLYPVARALKLGRAQYWSLAAQSLICIPQSLNFPRKLLLARTAKEAAPALFERVEPDRRAAIRRDFVAVLQYATQGGTENEELQAARSLLERLEAESDE
ncbi:MAG TPA: hypothetical protein VGJ75_20360 [Dongiaceae bacterium]